MHMDVSAGNRNISVMLRDNSSAGRLNLVTIPFDSAALESAVHGTIMNATRTPRGTILLEVGGNIGMGDNPYTPLTVRGN